MLSEKPFDVDTLTLCNGEIIDFSKFTIFDVALLLLKFDLVILSKIDRSQNSLSQRESEGLFVINFPQLFSVLNRLLANLLQNLVDKGISQESLVKLYAICTMIEMYTQSQVNQPGEQLKIMCIHSVEELNKNCKNQLFSPEVLNIFAHIQIVLISMTYLLYFKSLGTFSIPVANSKTNL